MVGRRDGAANVFKPLRRYFATTRRQLATVIDGRCFTTQGPEPFGLDSPEESGCRDVEGVAGQSAGVLDGHATDGAADRAECRERHRVDRPGAAVGTEVIGRIGTS